MEKITRRRTATRAVPILVKKIGMSEQIGIVRRNIERISQKMKEMKK